MYDYNSQQPPMYRGGMNSDQTQVMVGSAMKQVYLKMTIGLLVTAFVAYFCAGSAAYINFVVSNRWFMWVLLGVELLIVYKVSGSVGSMKSSTATGLFYLFSAVNGLALSPVFLIYTMTSIAKTFFITAATFGAMSVYGFFTTRSLAKFGSILVMCLIGLIIASLVNMFTHSTQLDWIISIAGVLIFVGLTAWDTQNIRQWCEQATPDQVSHIATIGALNLYLDFVNLFLYLLRFFGSSRD